MKNFATMLILMSATCISCTKGLNPRPSRHNDCPFSLSVSEKRQEADFLWDISPAGELSCDSQELQELWVSKWNDCLVEARSDDASFNGVNFISSDPSRVGVVPVDGNGCRLVYRSDTADGETVTIGAWSGEGHRTEFKVRSASVISLKGIMLHLGDMDIELPLSFYRERIYPDDPAYIWFDKVVDYAGYSGDTLRVGHLVPENASFRHVERLRFFSEADTLGELTGAKDLDWSEIEGKKAFCRPDATGITFHADFDMAGSKKSCAMVGRYRY